eukprot:1156958-Pelagomonas_calceolata.AAC.3
MERDLTHGHEWWIGLVQVHMTGFVQLHMHVHQAALKPREVFKQLHVHTCQAADKPGEIQTAPSTCTCARYRTGSGVDLERSRAYGRKQSGRIDTEQQSKELHKSTEMPADAASSLPISPHAHAPSMAHTHTHSGFDEDRQSLEHESLPPHACYIHATYMLHSRFLC